MTKPGGGCRSKSATVRRSPGKALQLFDKLLKQFNKRVNSCKEQNMDLLVVRSVCV